MHSAVCQIMPSRKTGCIGRNPQVSRPSGKIARFGPHDSHLLIIYPCSTPSQFTVYESPDWDDIRAKEKKWKKAKLRHDWFGQHQWPNSSWAVEICHLFRNYTIHLDSGPVPERPITHECQINRWLSFVSVFNLQLMEAGASGVPGWSVAARANQPKEGNGRGPAATRFRCTEEHPALDRTSRRRPIVSLAQVNGERQRSWWLISINVWICSVCLVYFHAFQKSLEDTQIITPNGFEDNNFGKFHNFL